MNKQILERICELAGLTEMAAPATDKEYIDAVKDYYENKNLVNLIRQGEGMARTMARDSEEHIQKSDYGNLIVKWIENQESIFLLGIVTKEGKLKKGDIKDINEWIDILVNKIVEGKILYTSPNEISEKLLNKVLTKLAEKNIQVIKQESPSISLGDEPHLKWKNIMIKRA